jgi:hypothetical protein
MHVHVFLMMLDKGLECLIMVAAYLSICRQWFILCSQCLLIVMVVWGIPFIIFSHLRAQMRWAASETRICRSQEGPVCFLAQCSVSWSVGVNDRELQPSMVPIVIGGQGK